jgi:meso-butanediol dehydrogenase / (S,S)-butanediol dehydrogenase / diacetyl reductase
MSKKRLQDKVAIISGGNTGIGRAIALRFVEEGATVVITARNQERANETLSLIDEIDGTGHFVACDVTQIDQCKHVIQETIATFGKLDVLVNNAGIIYRNKSVKETTAEEWLKTFDVNVNGVFYLSKFALPYLEATKGNIVNVASYVGMVGFKGLAAYCASKGALIQLTRAMALDHASEEVRINCVCPGSVHTEMITQAWEAYGEGAEDVWSSKHPLGRIAQPLEVANAILYLASEEASFLTGVVLPVDGGITAG